MTNDEGLEPGYAGLRNRILMAAEHEDDRCAVQALGAALALRLIRAYYGLPAPNLMDGLTSVVSCLIDAVEASRREDVH